EPRQEESRHRGIRSAMRTEQPRRERPNRRRSRFSLPRVTVSSVLSVSSVAALLSQPQAPDWNAVNAESTRLLQEYVRIDTSIPPGDTRKAADFLTAVLEHEGIPVKRYESAPGKAIVLARLEATTPARAGKP